MGLGGWWGGGFIYSWNLQCICHISKATPYSTLLTIELFFLGQKSIFLESEYLFTLISHALVCYFSHCLLPDGSRRLTMLHIVRKCGASTRHTADIYGCARSNFIGCPNQPISFDNTSAVWIAVILLLHATKEVSSFWVIFVKFPT